MTDKGRADGTGDEAAGIEGSNGGFGKMFVILIKCVDMRTLGLMSRYQDRSTSWTHLEPVGRANKAIGRKVG